MAYHKVRGGCSYELIGVCCTSGQVVCPGLLNLHLLQPHIVLGSLSTQSHPPLMMTLLPRCTEAYQSLIGSIGWLATATRPDLAPVHSFLSSYSSKPSSGHMRAALYALHYIHSTHNLGITFSSTASAPIHTYIHFPDSADVEAYSDAKPPPSANCAPLTTYSDA
jgi:hypothetical protein